MKNIDWSEYDIKKIIIFFSSLLLIIVALIMGIILCIKHFKKHDNTSTRTNINQTTLTDAQNENYASEEDCILCISQKLHIDIGEYITDCYGITGESNNFPTYIKATVKDENAFIDACNNKFGSEISINEISMPQFDNSIVNELNTQKVVHRWYIHGDQIPGAKGFEIHEVFITEEENTQYIYIII